MCKVRNPKGLYQKARAGGTLDFTGIHAPYEPAERPELVRSADEHPPEPLADQVIELLVRLGTIS